MDESDNLNETMDQFGLFGTPMYHYVLQGYVEASALRKTGVKIFGRGIWKTDKTRYKNK